MTKNYVDKGKKIQTFYLDKKNIFDYNFLIVHLTTT